MSKKDKNQLQKNENVLYITILSLNKYVFVYTFIKSANLPMLTLPCNMSDFVYPFDFIQIKKSRFLYPLSFSIIIFPSTKDTITDLSSCVTFNSLTISAGRLIL